MFSLIRSKFSPIINIGLSLSSSLSLNSTKKSKKSQKNKRSKEVDYYDEQICNNDKWTEKKPSWVMN